MKRFSVLLLSGLLLTGAAHAQLGVRVGGSLSKLRTTTGTNLYNSSDSRLGYQVGVTYQVPLIPHLSLVPEVQYSNEHTTLSEASYAIADVFFEADSRLSLHYLNVPVLLRAALGPVYVEAGPQASLLLGGRQTGTITTGGWGVSNTIRALDQSVTESNRRFDVGPCVGIGAQLPAGLGLNVRAYWGLTTLNKERSIFDGEHQRRSLQASLTYQLPTR
ncbi:hypothetical protein GCM10027422_38510 [Hymenobacter arcticus]